jgi:hypothetical protein
VLSAVVMLMLSSSRVRLLSLPLAHAHRLCLCGRLAYRVRGLLIHSIAEKVLYSIT